MHNSKPSHLLLVVSTLAIVFGALIDGFAQRNSGDYIVTDSTYSSGIVTRLGKDRLEFKRSKKSTPVIYSLQQVTGFGSEGEIYDLLVVNQERGFYKKLADGPWMLYEAKDSYILKMEDQLTQFNRTNFRSVLAEKLHCEGSDHSLSKVLYTNASITNYVNKANRSGCNTDQLVYRKLGFLAGYTIGNFKVDVENVSGLSNKAGSMSLGVFGDFPIYKPQSLFFSAEIHYTNTKPSFYREEQNRTSYLALELNEFTVPLGIKWVAQKPATVKPYLKVGAVFNYFIIDSPAGLIQTTSEASVIEISRHKSQIRSALWWV